MMKLPGEPQERSPVEDRPSRYDAPRVGASRSAVPGRSGRTDVSDPPTIAVRPWRLLAILLTSVACASLYALNVDSPVRTAAALGFILLAPGLALLAVLRIDEPMLQLALAP